MCCGGMFAVSLLMMFTQSPVLFNFWLYGGLLLNGGLVLYKTQAIIHHAKVKPVYDPINESIGIYLSSIICFSICKRNSFTIVTLINIEFYIIQKDLKKLKVFSDYFYYKR